MFTTAGSRGGHALPELVPPTGIRVLDGVVYQLSDFASLTLNNSFSGIQTITNASSAASSSTGALRVTGGIGVGGNVFSAGAIFAGYSQGYSLGTTLALYGNGNYLVLADLPGATGAQVAALSLNNGSYFDTNDFNIRRADHATVSFEVTTGHIYCQEAGTTGSAANAFINNAAANELLRSTSALRYKRDVEPLDYEIARRVLAGAKPIWFRSKCEADRADWSFYGFAAEDVAELDPRLAFYLADGRPDGVQYDRFTTHLIAGWQQHEAKIAALEAELESLRRAM